MPSGMCDRQAYRHAEQTRLIVLEIEILVRETLGSVDACAACAVAVEEVSALEHEIFDYAVEFGGFVALRAACMNSKLVHGHCSGLRWALT